MKEIPKEIKDKINDACIEHSVFLPSRETFAKGAEYGYQLAPDGREELEKENERLKMLIKDAYYYRTGGPRDDHGWQQFKSANKL